jgi:hypothetical protein
VPKRSAKTTGHNTTYPPENANILFP